MPLIEHAEFIRRQSLPLSHKIEMSQCAIEMWWKKWDGKMYVSYSGGKDSSALLHLVRTLFPETVGVYSDTGLEYPEVKQHIKTVDNIVTIRPKLSYRQVIEKYGYALISKEQSRFIYEARRTKSAKLLDIRMNGNKWHQGKIFKKWLPLLTAPFQVSHKCCDVLKKDPFKIYEKKSGNKPLLGNLAAESDMRVQSYLRFGCNAFDVKRPISTPIAFWTEQDVLHYLVDNSIAIPAVYGQIVEDQDGNLHTTGVSRTGCMWCLFGIHLEKNENRFQMMKRTHPKIWEYCINDLGIGEVLDFIHVPYE